MSKQNNYKLSRNRLLSFLKEKDLKIKELEDELATLKKKEKICKVKCDDNEISKKKEIDTKIKDFLSYECRVGYIDDIDGENYKSIMKDIKDMYLERNCLGEEEIKDNKYTAGDLASWYMDNTSELSPNLGDYELQKWYDNCVYKFENDEGYKGLVKAIDKEIKSL